MNPEGDYFASGEMDGQEFMMDEWPVRKNSKLVFENKI